MLLIRIESFKFCFDHEGVALATPSLSKIITHVLKILSEEKFIKPLNHIARFYGIPSSKIPKWISKQFEKGVCYGKSMVVINSWRNNTNASSALNDKIADIVRYQLEEILSSHLHRLYVLRNKFEQKLCLGNEKNLLEFEAKDGLKSLKIAQTKLLIEQLEKKSSPVIIESPIDNTDLILKTLASEICLIRFYNIKQMKCHAMAYNYTQNVFYNSFTKLVYSKSSPHELFDKFLKHVKKLHSWAMNSDSYWIVEKYSLHR